MKPFRRQWIEVFRRRPEGVQCLVCYETFAYLTANGTCPHCKTDLHLASVSVNMAHMWRGDALLGIPVVLMCAFGASYSLVDGLAGHWAIFNAIACTLNLAAGTLNIRYSLRNWMRWRAIKPLYERLKAEQRAA